MISIKIEPVDHYLGQAKKSGKRRKWNSRCTLWLRNEERTAESKLV